MLHYYELVNFLKTYVKIQIEENKMTKKNKKSKISSTTNKMSLFGKCNNISYAHLVQNTH